MPKDAIYHRTLSPVPVYDPVTNTIVDWSRTLGVGYQLTSLSCLSSHRLMFESPVALFAKPLQCFEDYATQFEKDFSILIIQGGMHPVIDIYPEKVHDGASEYWPVYEVISHFGWVGGKEIHVPKGTSGKAHLADLLSDNVPVRVAKNKPSGYESYATSDTNYLLGTDIDGRVIWYFDMRNSRGLQQPFADDRAPSAAKTGATILLKEAARQILLRF